MVHVSGYTRKDGTRVSGHMRTEAHGRYRRERLEDPKKFDSRSFRTVRRGSHLVITACPAGYYHDGSCSVGTHAQALRHPRSER